MRHDDDDRPRRSRRDDDDYRDDDYDDDRPRRKRGQNESHLVLYLAIGGGVLVLLLVVGGFVWLAVLAGSSVDRVRSAAARVENMNNLKQMALAMHTYGDVNKKFPSAAICDPAGKPLLSWRVTILPYVEQKALYDRFKLDEPWDSPHNKDLIQFMPRLYANPLAPNAERGSTNYRVFVEGGAGFEWSKGLNMPGDFKDGTSNTIMIAEAADSVPWTKPDELVFNPNGPLPRLASAPDRGTTVVLFDASARTLPVTISQQTLRALITRGAGDVPGGDF